MNETIRLMVKSVLDESNLFVLLVNRNKKKGNISDISRQAEKTIADISEKITNNISIWLLNELKLGKFSEEIHDEILAQIELETLSRGMIQDFSKGL